MLKNYGVEIEETMNFLDYYAKFKDEYSSLFPKFKLIYGPGEQMDPQLW
jgi:hypothetical protein